MTNLQFVSMTIHLWCTGGEYSSNRLV